jgi:hypothetical protein
MVRSVSEHDGLPLPWRIGPDQIPERANDIVDATSTLAATVYPPSNYPYTGDALRIAHQRAVEIVTAINHHDDLVAALDGLCKAAANTGSVGGSDLFEAIHRARAVLRQVKEATP